MGGLFGEEAGGEGLFVYGVHKDTALGMFGYSASVKADAGAARDLFEDGKQPLEFRAPSHRHLIY